MGVVRSEFRHEPGIAKLVLVYKSGFSISLGIILVQTAEAAIEGIQASVDAGA